MTDAVSQSVAEDKTEFMKATLPRLVGRLYVLPTLKYLKFREIMTVFTKNVKDEGDPVDRATLLLELMEIVGVGGDEKDYAHVLIEIIQANPPPPVMPWQRPQASDKESHEDIVLQSDLNYEGRDLAEIVATLSSVFGWTADYILGVMTFGEVIIYMQEALVIQYTDLNWRYNFSEVGFKKEGDDYVKIPLPQPDWMKSVNPVRRKTSTPPVPAGFQPTGVVIDYTKDMGGIQYDVPTTPDKAATAGTAGVPDDIRATDKSDSGPS